MGYFGTGSEVQTLGCSSFSSFLSSQVETSREEEREKENGEVGCCGFAQPCNLGKAS